MIYNYTAESLDFSFRVFTLFYFIATYAFWAMASQWAVDFYKVDEKDFGRIALTFFTNVRHALVFLFLVPALAFHWRARKKQLDR